MDQLPEPAVILIASFQSLAIAITGAISLNDGLFFSASDQTSTI